MQFKFFGCLQTVMITAMKTKLLVLEGMGVSICCISESVLALSI